MKGKYLYAFARVVLSLFLISILSIYTTAFLYGSVPRTENEHCLVYRTLKVPIRDTGDKVMSYVAMGLWNIPYIQYLHAISLSLLLACMMFLVEIAALIGAIVLLVFYIVLYGAVITLGFAIVYIPSLYVH